MAQLKTQYFHCQSREASESPESCQCRATSPHSQRTPHAITSSTTEPPHCPDCHTAGSSPQTSTSSIAAVHTRESTTRRSVRGLGSDCSRAWRYVAGTVGITLLDIDGTRYRDRDRDRDMGKHRGGPMMYSYEPRAPLPLDCRSSIVAVCWRAGIALGIRYSGLNSQY